MGFYDEMQAVATDVLSEFKQGSISLVRVAASSGPGWKPTAGSETTVALNAVASGVSARYVSSGLAIASDKQVILSGNVTPAPDMSDYVLIDGARYKIVAIETKPEAGTPVAFVLIVRRGG